MKVGASVAYIAASAAEVAAVKAWAEAQGSGVSSAPVESSSVPAAAATPAAAPAPTPVASTPATGTVRYQIKKKYGCLTPFGQHTFERLKD